MTRIDSARRAGFTLMELLTVMIIMSIVLATGITSYVGARRGMEMRAAIGSVQSTLSLARQHAVTKRRTTAVLFRVDKNTNSCFYIFERVGKATIGGDETRIFAPPPLPAEQGYWPSNGTLICNMSGTIGCIGGLNFPGGEWSTPVSNLVDHMLLAESGQWTNGVPYGFQVAEKMFLPPGIRCQAQVSEGGALNQNAMILFYANGKAAGVGKRQIKFFDKLGANSKTIEVYPLVGLVKRVDNP